MKLLPYQLMEAEALTLKAQKRRFRTYVIKVLDGGHNMKQFTLSVILETLFMALEDAC